MAGPREWSPRGKMKKYTVIGYWEDSGDIWIEWGEGYSAVEALKDTLRRFMDVTDLDADFLKKLTILTVMEGHQFGLLDRDEIFSGYDALTWK